MKLFPEPGAPVRMTRDPGISLLLGKDSQQLTRIVPDHDALMFSPKINQEFTKGPLMQDVVGDYAVFESLVGDAKFRTEPALLAVVLSASEAVTDTGNGPATLHKKVTRVVALGSGELSLRLNRLPVIVALRPGYFGPLRKAGPHVPAGRRSCR